jgi:hypothetical protein
VPQSEPTADVAEVAAVLTRVLQARQAICAGLVARRRRASLVSPQRAQDIEAEIHALNRELDMVVALNDALLARLKNLVPPRDGVTAGA